MLENFYYFVYSCIGFFVFQSLIHIVLLVTNEGVGNVDVELSPSEEDRLGCGKSDCDVLRNSLKGLNACTNVLDGDEPELFYELLQQTGYEMAWVSILLIVP